MSSRFAPHDVIVTDAVLSLDEDAVLSTNEVSREGKSEASKAAQFLRVRVGSLLKEGAGL